MKLIDQPTQRYELFLGIMSYKIYEISKPCKTQLVHERHPTEGGCTFILQLTLKKYQGEVFSPDLLELRGDGLEGGGRDYMRANVSLPATLIISSTAIEGEVTNISLRGALVHTQELLSPKENFNLHIEIPHSLFPLSPKVKMVRFEIYEHDGDVSYGLGVMFVDITEEDKRLISKLFT